MKSERSQVEFDRSVGTGVYMRIHEDSEHRTDTSWQAQLIVLDAINGNDRLDHRTDARGVRGVLVLRRTVSRRDVLQDA